MAARTYLPYLRVLVKGLHFYATRWQGKLNQHMTPEQVTCLTSLIGTLADCIDIFGPPNVGP